MLSWTRDFWFYEFAPRLTALIGVIAQVSAALTARQIVVPAILVGAAAPLLFNIYDVQSWTMPSALAVSLVTGLWVIVVGAAIILFVEAVRSIGNLWENWTTSPERVEQTLPGLLDYEPDGERALRRCGGLLTGLGRDTERLGKTLNRITADLNRTNLQKNARRRQRAGDRGARAIGRSAYYIERRAKLLRATVNDIERNYRGLIDHTDIAEPVRGVLLQGFDGLKTATDQAADNVRGYRESVQKLHDMNASRTIRHSTAQLGEALDGVLQLLDKNSKNSLRLHKRIERR